MKRLSLKDVAKLAGVAPSTVSFVLNGKAKQMRISDELADKIRAIVRKSGYQPHQVAVNLRTGQSKILGLIVESISGSFFASLAGTIESEAEKYGYRIVYCSTENDAKKGAELINMLSRQQVDGYLITPVAGMEQDIQQLMEYNKPIVLMDSYFPGLPAPHVLIDSYGSVAKGMEHLIKKGHKHIGLVTVDMDMVQIKERTKAYVDTLKEHGIPQRKKYQLKLPYNLDKEAAITAITQYLEVNPKLDAIFFTTNYLGIRGLETFVKLGLNLPKDLAMVCFDDHDLFRLYPPGITVIEQPVEEIAKTAIRMLMQQLNQVKGGAKKWQVALPGKFIVRGSS
ncbi:LacI family transcriptional regulator [Chitinophaga caeni]|uniref:LacI family transcriptional regulator n=1 Tax=Chitinophaga caeni TaxID=2029983 RepID=A0A291QQ73_9BACT|nr:substrate-binding domain-containing protein [Chitinophaga caeni]ATL46081.1 LacI family transcriptional regulator [Chitinophaga caeni]